MVVDNMEQGEIKKTVNVIVVAATALSHLNFEIKKEWKLDGKVSGLK